MFTFQRYSYASLQSIVAKLKKDDPNLKNVTIQDVFSNNSEDFLQFCEVLAKNTNLKVLKLIDNLFWEESLAMLEIFSKAIATNQGLVKLHILDGNSLTPTVMEILVNGLKANNTIETLKINNSDPQGVYDDQDMPAIKDLLLQNKSLKKLSLDGYRLNEIRASSLAHALQTNTTLSFFEICMVTYKLNTIKQLCMGLKTNTGLKILKFDGGSMEEGCVSEFLKALHDHKTLHSLCFATQLYESEVEEFANFIATNDTITKLDLQKMLLSDTAKDKLIAALHYNPRIVSLLFDNLSEKQKHELDDLLKRNIAISKQKISFLKERELFKVINQRQKDKAPGLLSIPSLANLSAYSFWQADIDEEQKVKIILDSTLSPEIINQYFPQASTILKLRSMSTGLIIYTEKIPTQKLVEKRKKRQCYLSPYPEKLSVFLLYGLIFGSEKPFFKVAVKVNTNGDVTLHNLADAANNNWSTPLKENLDSYYKKRVMNVNLQSHVNPKPVMVTSHDDDLQQLQRAFSGVRFP